MADPSIVEGNKPRVLLIYRRMTPSVRLCGHLQMEQLAAQGEVSYRAVQELRLSTADMNWAQIVLLGRFDSWYEAQLADMLRKAGKYLIYILDDDLLNIPREIHSARYYRQREPQACIRRSIEASNAILSPSPLLLEKYATGGRRAIPIEEPAVKPIPYHPHGTAQPVRIGFAGSVDRVVELESVLGNVLEQLKAEYGSRIAFEFFGAVPSFAQRLEARCIPYTASYDQYRDTLNRLEWDIGLAPMIDTPFHACKHYNKFVEYAAAGIAGVFSDIGPYKRLARFGGCALLCDNTSEAWGAALRALLDDHALLENTRQKASEAAGSISVARCAAELLPCLDSIPLDHSGRRVSGPLLGKKAVNIAKRGSSKLRSVLKRA